LPFAALVTAIAGFTRRPSLVPAGRRFLPLPLAGTLMIVYVARREY
jgi:hypothetical protein